MRHCHKKGDKWPKWCFGICTLLFNSNILMLMFALKFASVIITLVTSKEHKREGVTQLTCHRRWSLDWPRAALWSRSSNVPSACHPPATTPPGNTLTQPLIPCITPRMITNLIDTWHYLICCMTCYESQHFVNSCIIFYTIIIALLHSLFVLRYTLCDTLHAILHASQLLVL